jgi:ribosomal protein S12 methylthiotransferase
MGKQKINVVTLGCSKNLVDSEVLLRKLEVNGYDVVHDSPDDDSDIVVVNTCGFILDAKEESVNTILNFVDAKKGGLINELYVMGCLSARYKKELSEEIPEVDGFFGKFDQAELVKKLVGTSTTDLIYERKLTTPSHFAYLKISEGCNRTCSFCAIPQFTGMYKSKPFETVLKEAEYLAKKGVKELLLIAQDLSYYGKDLYNENRLAELVDALSQIPGIKWIRLHYAYPAHFPHEVLKIMHERDNVCKYLDIPLQHISDNMLAKMRRNVTKEEVINLVKRFRKEVPGVVLRTTMLVGHPGETEEDFEELKQFVREAKFDRLGVFAYSHEEGTYAAKKYKDNIPQEVKDARAAEIMAIQEQISAELNARRVGQTLNVLIDREDADYFVGRTEYDSPEVDGEVLISKEIALQIGEFYQVKITNAEEFDLFGTIVSA